MNIENIIKLGVNENVAKKILDVLDKHIKEQLEDKTKMLEKEFFERLKQAKFELDIEKELIFSGAKNVVAAKALIDTELIKKCDINKVKEKIDMLKNDPETNFLFNQQTQNNQSLKGITPFESNFKKVANIKNMNYEELCNYYEDMFNI